MFKKIIVPGLFLLTMSGCDSSIFSVENPTNLTDDDLDSPVLLDALGNTPEGEFSDGFDDVVTAVALISDEGFHVTTQTDPLNLVAGVMDGWNLWYEGIYNRLSAARWIAADVTTRLEGLVQNPTADRRVAQGYFWDGIGRMVLADLFEAVTFDGEAPITPLATYETAVTRLLRAAEIAEASGDRNTEAAAYGSIARIHRSMSFDRGGNIADFELAKDYAERALSISSNYRVDVRYQEPGHANGLIARFNVGPWDALDPRYANLQDPVSGALDPRIMHGPLSTTAVDGRDVYLQQKYPDRNADIAISRWQDAELIIAEYHIQVGDPAAATPHINNVRRAVPLPDYPGGDAEDVFAQLQYERITTFWLEGRRWQDMRYWGIIPPDWTPEQKARGLDRRWPISDAERASNPNL